MVEFNSSQRLGLDLDRHIALDAGAGTGKTTVMAERYVQHLIAMEQRATHFTPLGPRTPLSGHGALRTPKRERTDLKSWPGLLPSEVVAITFTRKSAAELKARIRHRLAQSRATPLSHEDLEGIFDPRLRSEGDVEMLLSGLDEAPISTIDAFLNQLVQPYIDLVSLYPSNQQVSEERAPLMLRDTLHAVWRIRSTDDAREAGVLNHHQEFLAARDRLVARLGGQDHAEVVLNGLLDRSLFVEQSHRSMIQRAQSMGLHWNGRGPVPIAVLLNTIAEPVVDLLDGFVSGLANALSAWVNEIIPYHQHLIQPADGADSLTRFNHLVRLTTNPLPTEPGEQLSWVWKATMPLAAASNLTKPACNFFPRSNLPNGDGWPSGIMSKSKVKTLPSADVKDIYARAAARLPAIVNLLHSENGTLIRLLARSAFLIHPGDGYDGIPLDSPLRLDPLEEPLPQEPSERGTYISPELQTQVLSDMMVLHTACNQILARRKSLDGMHDFDDMQRFAADLLLARCPDVCRHRYPPEVIDALDSMGDEPWRDDHISRALTMLNDRPVLQEDLHRRFIILGELRRQYRAFIIDEYQDTNPSHYRLLARLWGRRLRKTDDPEGPLGAWDPTVCIVGDMKQSIYRFRQAEVSVMRRAVAAIRQFNLMEAGDERLNHLREPDSGRDPRPVGSGGETGSFSNEHDGLLSAPHTHVPYGEEDNPDRPAIEGERLQRRREGHIDLTSNHRTRHNLMETMNDIFDEVFDSRYHALPGDWHAEPQRLQPARGTDREGVFEWLLPIQGSIQAVPMDLDQSVETFADPAASTVQLEHELIADRLHALLAHADTRVWDSQQKEWMTVSENDSPTRPEDIMILINSRKHLPDLVERLRARRIPVMADRQGLLVAQPVVQPLMALLALMANPNHRKAGIELARSAVIGMTEQEVHDAFSQWPLDQSVWECVLQHAPSDAVRTLLEHVHQLVSWGAVYDAFDAVMDHSDLFVAYPDDAQRQFAEAWLAMVYSIGQETGHDVSAMQRRMIELRDIGSKGPQAIAKADRAAVQIMTIHGSKGLQAPVVVVSGLFSAGKADATMAIQDNILVTPQVVSGRIHPWRAIERPNDGLWAFASEMNKAQDKAELRRKFYVALTRVKDRLIVTGSPGPSSTFDEESGLLAVRLSPDPRTMGRMLLEGLRRASWCAADADSPWLVESDFESDHLPPFVPLKTQTPINPAALLTHGRLGVAGLAGIRLYHHPACFARLETVSPQQRARILDQHLAAGPTVAETSSPRSTVVENIKGAAHHLDGTHTCGRKYWLEHIKGWATEPFVLPSVKQAKVRTPSWPQATEFGLMMHRVLEIGLRNPLAFSTNTPLLDPSWHHVSEDDLASDSTVARVMNEFGYGETQPSGRPEASWRDRLLHLGALVDQGLIGRWVGGEHLHGWSVEAVRTELPFFHREHLSGQSSALSSLLSDELREAAQIAGVNMDFSGRADLVLALVNEQGQGALQVVDLKTRGCLAAFNPETPSLGHPLQHIGPETTSPLPQSQAEHDILHEHRLQLTLYSIALEAMEARRPKDEQRLVLPPALLLGANGRMVQLTNDEFLQAKSDLNQHLAWRSAVHLNPDLEEPPRLPSGSEHCRSCPFYRGDLRRCGPEGEPLGFVHLMDDEP
jgi:ATP-dependent exoDNAse (exonuclease V) beta subunit